MKHLYITRAILSALILLSLTVGRAQAQYQNPNPNVNGTISPGEYGGAANTYSTGASNWYVTWNNGGLLSIALDNVAPTDAVIIYFDLDGATPVTIGPGAKEAYFGTQWPESVTGTLPFAADAALYSRGSSAQDPNIGSVYQARVVIDGVWQATGRNLGNDRRSFKGTTRELNVPWSVLKGAGGDNTLPATLNWFGYVVSGSGSTRRVYGQAPLLNSPIAATGNAAFAHYFTIPTLVPSNPEFRGPFARNSYTYAGSSTPLGSLNVWDFTLNTPISAVTRNADANSTWNISNNLLITQGTLNVGQSSAAINIGGNLTVLNTSANSFRFDNPAGVLRVGGSLKFPSNTAFQVTAPIELTAPASKGPQVTQGASYATLSITGGGTYTVDGSMTVTSSLAISNGLLKTIGTNRVTLNRVLEATAAFREGTDQTSGYLEGILESSALINSAPRTYNFGGNDVGIKITTRLGPTLPGETSIQRLTGSAVGANNNRSVGRQYIVLPARNGQNAVASNKTSAALAALDVDFEFNFRRSNPDELNGLDLNKLSLFVSQTGEPPFTELGYNARTATSITKTKLTTLQGFYTLGQVGVPLPVELNAFAAKLENTAVRLNWSTASEKNNKGFEVQRSTEAGTWSTLGFVAGNGSSTQANAYSYLDRTAPAGNTAYRLRQLDNDGTESFSPVVTLVVPAGNELASQLALSPVPTTDRLNISGLRAGKHVAEVYDMLGKRVLTHSFASSEATVSVAALPQGVYVMVVQDEAGQASHKSKFVKQ